MTETEEIDKLLESSRNAYLHEKDAKLSKKLRIGALDDAFMCQMIGACEKYYTLMKEMLDYQRRDNLEGTAAFSVLAGGIMFTWNWQTISVVA